MVSEDGSLEVKYTAVPNEQPLYWDRCGKMNPGELGRFIDYALKRLSEPPALADEELPRSETEFLKLCEMLSAKTDESKEDAPDPVPEEPTYNGPADPWFFEPSDNLAALHQKQEKYARRVDEAYADGSSKTYIEYVEAELRKVEREVGLLDDSEKREYNQRLKEYRQAREAHIGRVRSWRAAVDKEQKRRQREANRERLVTQAYREIKRAFRPEPTGRVQWEILPSGEATNERVRGYYERLQREGRIAEIDWERLDKALALPWEDWRPGRGGVENYSIFTFAHTQRVLLECPAYGNAVYVVNSGEERWLTMTKQELIESGEAKKIVHAGDWDQRVKEVLEIE